ncbi:MAG: hypothetical protein RLZ56_922 [Bacteroidota bacterium]|jgi:hypothetical protein
MRNLLTICFLFSYTLLHAQNPLGSIGQWRSHYNNYSIQSVVEGDAIYAAAPNQIIQINANKTLNWIDKSTGLHDVGIQQLAWDPSQQQLITIYHNSNIDILKGDQVFNINAIERTNLYSNKNIYAIKLLDKWGILATQFGIVVLDLVKHEIKNTWFPSANQQPVITYDIAIFKDSIYAATENGVWKSTFSNNANIPIQWEHLTQYDQVKLQHLISSNNNLFGYSSNSIYQFPSNNPVLSFQHNRIQDIAANGSDFYICIQYPNHKGAILQTSANYTTSILVDSNILNTPMQTLVDQNQNLWVADSTKGLFLKNNTTQWMILGGPTAGIGGKLFMQGNQLIAPYGNNEKGYAIFDENRWKSIAQIGNDTLPNLTATTSAGMEQGLWFTANHQLLHINGNSFETIQPNGLTGNYTAIQQTANQHLWLLQDQQGLVQFDLQKWTSIPLPNNMQSNGLQQFIMNKSGQAWLIAPNQQGLYIYQSNEVYNTSTWKQLSTQPNNGNLNSSNVTSLAEDKIGSIWVGTDNGIAIFNCGDIANEPCNAYLPIVNNNGFNGYLFQHETIHCIEVDGANRKWIGTNKGAWLLSADGLAIIEHFTKDNSPLPIDTVNEIKVQPITGEVFFKCKEQVISYRGTATEGAEQQNKIQIFPNPVGRDFNGNIAFRGLVDNAIVKITDLAGKLLYQTIALGGQAIWNGKTYEGHKVASGIYLVFVRNLSGEEQGVGKIVIANGY